MSEYNSDKVFIFEHFSTPFLASFTLESRVSESLGVRGGLEPLTLFVYGSIKFHDHEQPKSRVTATLSNLLKSSTKQNIFISKMTKLLKEALSCQLITA